MTNWKMWRFFKTCAGNLTKMMPRKEREFEGINSHWHPKAEAFFFWRLVQMKKATAHTVRQDLLMTEPALERLIRQYPQEKGTLKDIYEQRLETWKEFCYLLKHPQAAPKFQRAASIYSSGART